MDIKQLRAVLAIAEIGTVTGAAQLLNTVQPVISRRIKMLEDELGCVLFRRTPTGMVATENGEITIRHARVAVRETDLIKANVQADPFLTGDVVIGMIRSIHERHSRSILTCTHEKHGNINLRISVGYARNIEAWVRNGEIDAAFLYIVGETSGLNVEPFVREHLCLVGLPGQPLSTQSAIGLHEIHGLEAMIPSHLAGLEGLIAGETLRRGTGPKLRLDTSGKPFEEVLRINGGYAILPACSVATELEGGRLEAAPITELTRTLSIAYSAVTDVSPPTRAVIQVIRELITESVHEGRWFTAELIAPFPRD